MKEDSDATLLAAYKVCFKLIGKHPFPELNEAQTLLKAQGEFKQAGVHLWDNMLCWMGK